MQINLNVRQFQAEFQNLTGSSESVCFRKKNAFGHDCPRFRLIFRLFTEFSIKTWVLNIFWRFFFLWKLRYRIFQKWKRGIKRGITWGCILVWNHWKIRKFSKFAIFSNQNTAPDDPLFDPLFSFLKNTISQLSQEKNRQKIFKTRNVG